ncbi:MAG: glycosyltransferase family 2 protein [Candidatus Bathyarchaeia archaeon]
MCGKGRGLAILMQGKLCENNVMFRRICYPPISIIVPVYNAESRVSEFIGSLFKSAAQYPNFCEILVVDDGSSDCTYEIAWATIQKCRRKWPNIKGRVIRNSASVGKAEVFRMGVDRALGELIIAINREVLLKPNALKEIVKGYYSGEYRLEAGKSIKVFQNPWFS